MRNPLLHLPLACAVLFASQAFAQDNHRDELQELREEIRLMRNEYEARIADLETRLDAAENAATHSTTTAVKPDSVAAVRSPETVTVARESSFNPAIAATFQGQAWSYDNDPANYYIPGFPLGGEAGPAPEGLSLAETEITMSANVDDKFTAMLTVPIVIEDGDVVVELEEAWVETLSLPAAFSIRMGRFFSDIGYLNDRHFHSWDFADQPLAYQVFLGNQYIDDGLQFHWLAPTDFYLQFSGEVLRGDRFPAGGASNSGVGSTTLSMTTGGDIGFNNSWQFGLAWLGAEADERESGDEDDPLLFTGDTDLFIADFIWKWAPNGNSRQENFKFQAEYLWRNEKGVYAVSEEMGGAWDHRDWDHDQSGWYAQAVYQPFPRWRFGARIDQLSGGTPGVEWLDTPLYPHGDDPSRYSVMVDWSNSEFSRLRFQYTHDRASQETDNQFGLQYIFSIGAHGAHSF